MGARTGTYEIGFDTPIHMLTPRQLFEMQEEWLSAKTPQPKQKVASDRWHVNSVGELAKILGTSESTVYKMKSKGLLDEAISQYGRWMVIDVNKVLEIFSLSGRGKKKSVRKY